MRTRPLALSSGHTKDQLGGNHLGNIWVDIWTILFEDLRKHDAISIAMCANGFEANVQISLFVDVGRRENT